MLLVQCNATTYREDPFKYGTHSALSFSDPSQTTPLLDWPHSNRAVSPTPSPFNYHYTVATPLCLKARAEAVRSLARSRLAYVLKSAVCVLLAGLALAHLPLPAVAAQRPGFEPEVQLSLSPALENLRQGHIGDKVTVEGRTEANQAGHQVMALDYSGRLFTVQTGSRGEFLLETIPAGSYTLIASSPGFLSATCTSVTHTGDNLRLNEMILLAGDLDNSGEIDMVDVVQLGAAFGQASPAEGADLNADSRIDILDLILLAANHGQTAIANPWLCQ